MKRLLCICVLLISSAATFAQFPDTAALNQYIRDTLKDRRPDKITVAQLQKAFLGVTAFLQQGGGGGGGAEPTIIDTLTVSEANSLEEDSLLIPGGFYCITGADFLLYGGTTILIRALSPHQFGSDGVGYFYNPDYRFGGFEIWDGELTEIFVDYMETSLYPGEHFLTEDSKSGKWIKEDVALLLSDNGQWTPGSYTITGQLSENTANIVVSALPSYTLGTKVAWGGKVWVNISGSAGYRTGLYLLNEEDWELLPYTDPAYVMVVDPIKYNLQEDKIVGRREEAGDNEVYFTPQWQSFHGGNPIRSFQWGHAINSSGNPYLSSLHLFNSDLGNINFKGQSQSNMNLSNSRQEAMYFDSNSWQRNITMEGSLQNSLIFINSYQDNFNFHASIQMDAVFNDAFQTRFTFINAEHKNFFLNSATHDNINLWGYEWDREFADPVFGEDANVYKFGPTEGDSNPEQTFVRTQDSDLSPLEEGSEEVFAPLLDFTAEEDASYVFEYELYFYNLMSDTLLINLATPSSMAITTFFTSTDVSTGNVTFWANIGNDSASLALPTGGSHYYVRISGVTKRTAAGPIRLGLARKNPLEPGMIILKAGSFAKFSRFKVYPIPEED